MKITIIGTAYPYRGGLSVYNERLANEFLKNNHEVTIQTFTLQYPNFLFPGKTQYADWEAPKNLKIERCINSVNPFNWIKVGKKIKKQKPDIVIIKYWLPFMGPAFGTIAKIIRKNKHTKIISILDNIIPHEKRAGDKMFSKYFVKNIDGFIAMSKSVLNDLSIFDTVKPREFCPHPLYDNFGERISRDKALQNLNLDLEYKYILFFGLIRDYKGLDLLIKAFADKRLREHKVRLIIAGEFYSDSQKYYSLIKENNLDKHIILKPDFIPDAEVANYFCGADLIAQPYKSATQSGVTQIAYHFEKPMLVTNVGGLAEIVPDKKVGYVVNPDVKEIADALLDFVSNKTINDFYNNILIEKKKYEWSNMLDTITRVYKKL